LQASLQEREALEMPGRHRAADVSVGKIEHRSLERRHEIAEAGHHDVADLRLRQHRFELMREVLHDHDGRGARIRELFLEFARRVERIDVDDREPCAQRAEKCHRIRQQVRQHDGDTVAGPALCLFDEEGGEGPADALPFAIAHAHIEALEGGMCRVPRARVEQHRR
jgi:hypothetical protein